MPRCDAPAACWSVSPLLAPIFFSTIPFASRNIDGLRKSGFLHHSSVKSDSIAHIGEPAGVTLAAGLFTPPVGQPPPESNHSFSGHSPWVATKLGKAKLAVTRPSSQFGQPSSPAFRPHRPCSPPSSTIESRPDYQTAWACKVCQEICCRSSPGQRTSSRLSFIFSDCTQDCSDHRVPGPDELYLQNHIRIHLRLPFPLR